MKNKWEVQKKIVNALRSCPKKCLSINQLRKKINSNWSTTDKYLKELILYEWIIPQEEKVIVGYKLSPDFDTTFFDYMDNYLDNKNKTQNKAETKESEVKDEIKNVF